MNRRGPYRAKASRLADALAVDIAAGRWRPGEFLPAEQELCAKHAVARLTLRRSFDLLVERSLLRRIPHRGLLVNHADGSAAEAPTVRRRGPVKGQLTLAAVCAVAPDEGMRGIQAGIQEYCRAHDLAYQIIAANGDEGPFEMLEHVESLGVSGVIVLPHPGPEHRELLASLQGRGFSAVCVERRSLDLHVPSVEIDNRVGMYHAVQHLLLQHHRPVWYIGMRSSHRADSDRYDGYRLAMLDAGYGAMVNDRTVLHEMDTADPAYWHVENPWQQGYEVAQRLFSMRGESFWSVACQKDYIAWGLYRAASERGLVVGRQVVVTGFDDMSVAEQLDPPLTTVRQSFHQKGWKAASLLHRRIGGDVSGPTQVKLGTQLVRRTST